MALTSDNLTYIRAMTGASTSDVSDVLLNYFYANQAAGVVDNVIVYCLRAQLAQQKAQVTQTNSRTGDTHAHNQYFEHLKDMLKDWESRTGLTPPATVGSINLGIDEEDTFFNIT